MGAFVDRTRRCGAERRAGYALRRKYGVTADKMAALIAKSGGKCEICKRVPTDRYGLCVDHDHATGVVRGLLCHKCNKLLGHAQDSVEILSVAIRYLQGAE